MGYRNRPDRRRPAGMVPFADASVITPTIEFNNDQVRFVFPAPMAWNAAAVLSDVMGCFDASTGEPGLISSIAVDLDNTRVTVELGFNIETNYGLIWFYYDQTDLIARDGRIVSPTPWAAPVV